MLTGYLFISYKQLYPVTLESIKSINMLYTVICVASSPTTKSAVTKWLFGSIHNVLAQELVT